MLCLRLKIVAPHIVSTAQALQTGIMRQIFLVRSLPCVVAARADRRISPMAAFQSGFAVEQVGQAVAIKVNRTMISPDALEGFGQTLDSLITTSEEPRIIVDLAGVEFLPTAMLGHLIAASTKLRRKECRLRLVNVNEHIQGVLHVTRVRENFDFFETLNDAVASFGRGASDPDAKSE